MKNYQLLLFIFLALSFASCNGPDESNKKYSEKEITVFLDTIVKNSVVCIDDFTEIKREPTTDLLVYTRYPLSEKLTQEYNKSGVLDTSDEDISNLVSYEIKRFELTNEKGQQLKFVENGRANYLQETALGEFNGALNQRLIVRLNVDKVYSTLKGFITIEFRMPDNTKRETKIPVNISINDKAPE